MTINAPPKAIPPLISVIEHPDARAHPRIAPEGMIGTIRFCQGRPEDMLHFVGRNISQSGAAVIVAIEQGRPLADTGQISIFAGATTIRDVPFRIVRSRRLSKQHIELGIQFVGRLIPEQQIQDLTKECRTVTGYELADHENHENLNSSENQ